MGNHLRDRILINNNWGNIKKVISLRADCFSLYFKIVVIVLNK